jgi:hypothetical protein
MNIGMARVAPAAAVVPRNRRRVIPLTGGHFLARIMGMIVSLRDRVCKAAIMSLLFFLPAISACADWQRDDNSIAWQTGTNVVWRFSFDRKFGKPFFNPLTVAGGPELTNFRPKDHPWHYGLWFSWKYINHVNYWEEDRATGKPAGATRWANPVIETQPDGSATIHLNLSYVNPSNQVEMTEQRALRVSAPAADGSYTIEWRAAFIAGAEGAILDRTPMPGEPKGQVNGGYAGIGLRMASQPAVMSVVSTTGPVTHFESDRARPNAAAVGCNFTMDAKSIGSIAIFSDPANAGENAPWYLINSTNMRFACAAILAPKIITLPPSGKLNLHYRFIIQPQPWTPETLVSTQTQWLRDGHSTQ